MRSFYFVAICSVLSVYCGDGPSAFAQTNFLWIADMEEGSLADWYFPETSEIGDCGGGIFPSGKYSYFASIMEGRGNHSLAATIWTPSTIPNETSGVRAFRWKEPRENRELYFSACDAAISTTRTAGVPTPPCNLIATCVSSAQINLAWTSSLYAATGYKVERKKGGGDWCEIAKLPVIATTYSSTGLTEDTAYSYRVRAFNEITNSAFSNTTTAETQREDSKNARGNSRNNKNRFKR